MTLNRKTEKLYLVDIGNSWVCKKLTIRVDYFLRGMQLTLVPVIPQYSTSRQRLFRINTPLGTISSLNFKTESHWNKSMFFSLKSKQRPPWISFLHFEELRNEKVTKADKLFWRGSWKVLQKKKKKLRKFIHHWSSREFYMNQRK